MTKAEFDKFVSYMRLKHRGNPQLQQNFLDSLEIIGSSIGIDSRSEKNVLDILQELLPSEELLPPEPRGGEEIQRYMSFSQLEEMLLTNALSFAHIENWKRTDPCEAFPYVPLRYKEMYEDLWEIYPKYTGTHFESTLKANENWSKENCYVSCWCVSNVEERKMWEEYTHEKIRPNDSLCIKTTYNELMSAVSEAMPGCKVNATDHDSTTEGFYYPEGYQPAKISYIDYEDDFIPVCVPLHIGMPLFYKKEKFSFAKEFRVIWFQPPIQVIKDFGSHKEAKLHHIKNMGNIIKEVILCPSADASFEKRIRKLLNDNGLEDVSIQRSAFPNGGPAS